MMTKSNILKTENETDK